MSEVITVHVGGSGINVGLSFWDQLKKNQLSYQQRLQQDNETQRVYYQRFFDETKSKQTIPRAIFIDSDCRSRSLVERSMHKQSCLVTAQSGNSCRNLWAEGFYIEGALLMDQILQLGRKEVEKCDLFSGFIITSSPCGGAGSGMGSLVLSKFREEYPERIIEDFKILPGPNSQNQLKQLNPLQIYNIVLSSHQSTENSELVYFCENNAVSRTLLRRGKLHPSYTDINSYLGNFLNEHISSYIQSGNLNTNQRKRATNLVPFPRLKNICGILNDPKAENYLQSGLDDINKLMIHPSSCDKRIFTLNLNARDNFTSENQVTQKFNQWFRQKGNMIVEWIPHPLHLSLGRPILNNRESALTLINGTHNIAWLRKVGDLFTKLFRRRAYVSHYTGIGLDQMQMTQAQSNCNDLISQYTPCSCCAMGDDDEYMDQQQA